MVVGILLRCAVQNTSNEILRLYTLSMETSALLSNPDTPIPGSHLQCRLGGWAVLPRVPSPAGRPAGGAAGSVCTCVLPAGSDTLITGEEREVLVITRQRSRARSLSSPPPSPRLFVFDIIIGDNIRINCTFLRLTRNGAFCILDLINQIQWNGFYRVSLIRQKASKPWHITVSFTGVGGPAR